MSNLNEQCQSEQSELDVEQLMEDFYTGDDHALEILMRRMRSSLCHQAYSQLPARHVGRRYVAEDMVQKTWIKVAATRQREKVRWDRSKGAVRTWLGHHPPQRDGQLPAFTCQSSDGDQRFGSRKR